MLFSKKKAREKKKALRSRSGVLLGIAPMAVLIGMTTWTIIFYSTRYVSLGSIIAAAVVAVTGWVGGYTLYTAIALTLLSALTIWRHRANIQRLMNGTENKIERKKKS